VQNAQHFSHFTVIYGKETENRWVLSLVLNDVRELEDITSDVKLFQVLAAVSRSLIVVSRVSGTISAEVDC